MKLDELPFIHNSDHWEVADIGTLRVWRATKDIDVPGYACEKGHYHIYLGNSSQRGPVDPLVAQCVLLDELSKENHHAKVLRADD